MKYEMAKSIKVPFCVFNKDLLSEQSFLHRFSCSLRFSVCALSPSSHGCMSSMRRQPDISWTTKNKKTRNRLTVKPKLSPKSLWCRLPVCRAFWCRLPVCRAAVDTLRAEPSPCHSRNFFSLCARSAFF